MNPYHVPSYTTMTPVGQGSNSSNNDTEVAWQAALHAAFIDLKQDGTDLPDPTIMASLAGWHPPLADFGTGQSIGDNLAGQFDQPARRGMKWTSAMDEFLLDKKRAGETYAAIAEKMGHQFGVSVNANMLGKRFKAIAKLASNDSIVHKALVNAAPKIVDAVKYEIQQLNIEDEQMLDDVNKEMLSKLPELLKEAAVDLWVQAQARRKM